MNDMWWAVGGFLAAFIIEGLVLYLLIPMLAGAGSVGRNYRGEEIPVSAGISFPMTLLAVYLLYLLFHRDVPGHQVLLLGVTAISFLGLVDDMLGRRDTTGLKGHLGALMKGRLTTGGLKALGGGVVSLYLAAFISADWGNIILNTFLIALTTNFMNLLDLRPGRAIKGSLFLGIILVAAAYRDINWMLLLPLWGAVLYYFPTDLKARAMMGDAGSNVLGLSMGFWAATFLPLSFRAGLLVLLIAVHWYTEHYSLTETIERVKVLRVVDQLGRNENRDK